MHYEVLSATQDIHKDPQASCSATELFYHPFHLIAHSTFFCIVHSAEQANRGLKVLYSIVQIHSPNHIGPKSQPATCLSPICTLGQFITPRVPPLYPSLLFWVCFDCVT